MQNSQWHGALTVIGRTGLASLFLLGGLNKLLAYSETMDRMAAEGLVPASILLPMTILLELSGGIALVAGRFPAFLAGLALALFMLATNAAFHRFWELSEPIASLELSLFFKNISIAGALVYVAMTERARTMSEL